MGSILDAGRGEGAVREMHVVERQTPQRECRSRMW